MSNESEPTPVTEPKEEAMATTKKSKRAKAAKPAPSKSAAAVTAKPTRKTPARAASKPSVARKQTSKADRAKILAVADREGLTASQVQKRFGVKPVTYYSWRKASKSQRGPSRRVGRPKLSGDGLLASFDLRGQLREAVKREINRLLPEIIREELKR